MKILTPIFFSFLIIGVGSAYGADWYDSNWFNARKITIDPTDIDTSDLTDYPLYVNMTLVDIGTDAQADCDDFVFVDSTNVTKFNHETETCDAANNWAEFWVKIPTVAFDADTILFMYYNNTGATDQQSTQATWNSNYHMVLHLNNTLLDSTSNGNDVDVNENSTTHSDNYIGDSQNFDGNNDELRGGLTAGGRAIFDGGGTISAWINPNTDGGGNNGRWIDTADTSLTGYFAYILNETGSSVDMGFSHRGTTAIGTWTSDGVVIDLNEWSLISITFNDSADSNDPLFYVNGSAITVHQDLTPITLANPTADFHIGDNYLSDIREWDGEIDEVRLNTALLAANWIKADWECQRYDASCITIGSEGTEPVGTTVPGVPTGLTTSVASATSILLSWTAPVDDGGSPITGYQIERESPVGGGWAVLVADTGNTDTTYTNMGLTSDTQYNYRVSAINAIGTGSPSNEAEATPASFITETFNSSFEAVVATNKGSNQGITGNGTYFWVTGLQIGGGSQFFLYQYDSSWALETSRDATADMPAGATQINGIQWYNDKLYVGGNNFNTVPAKAWIFEYDPDTLTLLDTHLLNQAKWGEGGAWFSNDFWAIFVDDGTIARYNSTFDSVGNYTSPYTNDRNSWYQGGVWIDNHYIVNLHGSANAEFPHAADIITWNGTGFEKGGRIIQPTWSDAQDGSGQDFWIDETNSKIYWAERNNTAGQHDVVRSDYHKYTTVDTAFEDAIAAITNLRLHLPLREQTGTTFQDASPSNHDGSLVGGRDLTTSGDIVGYTNNRLARGVMLDDTADQIEITDHADFDLTTNFSYGLFVNFRNNADGTHYLFTKGAGGELGADNYNFNLFHDPPPAANQFVCRIEDNGGTDYTVESTTTPLPNFLYFVVCVYDSDNDEMRIYIDGTLENTTSSIFTPNTNAHDITINGLDGGTNQAEFVVFEPFFAATALTDEQVDEIWDAASGVTVPTAPTNLTATAVSTTQIDLDWDHDLNNGTNGFRIFRESPVGGGWAVLVSNTTTTTTFYNNTSLTCNTQYNYMVAALNENGTSNNSTAANDTTDACPVIPSATPSNATTSGWAQACVEANEKLQSAHSILLIVTLVYAAVLVFVGLKEFG